MVNGTVTVAATVSFLYPTVWRALLVVVENAFVKPEAAVTVVVGVELTIV